MPFDATSPFQPHRQAGQPVAAGTGALAAWLLTVAAMVFLMIGLGGATRLTGSGLSIMEWAPLSGILPPLSEAEWQRLYDLYRTIPQYALVNQGFGLDGFRQIFWLEYLHRLWGRLIGVAYALPLAWFWWRGRVPAALKPRLLLLLALGGLQGAVGWFMVASGFEAGRTAVSPFRLVIHLGLAFLVLALLLDTALTLLHPRVPPAPGVARAWARLSVGLAVATMLAGGFVAGIRAGFDYNTFPLMAGRLVPDGYFGPGWRAAFDHIATVQFNHRLLATATLLASIGTAIAAWAQPGLRQAGAAFLLAVLAQYALGVATLLAVVPVGLGTLHQMMAAVVLAAGTVLLHRTRRSPRD